MKVSFVIVNYKSKKYLEKCILSIAKKAIELDFEIIVVNNDKEKLESFGKIEKYLNKINIIEINENVGFSRANNIGAKKSRGDILCFLNPDANFISDTIVDLIKEFDANNEIGVIGPKVLKEGKIQPWSVGVDMDIFEILRSKFGFSKSKRLWNSNKKTEVDWVSGVSLFVKKELFLLEGGFDENFFLYYEDVDLCKRIRKMNKKVIYFPFFEVAHLEGGSSCGKSKQKNEYFKSQNYFYEKWFNRKFLWILKFFRFFYKLRYWVIRHN
ncbi:MAG: glycosyltransferase family 2 protein [Parcubacteria group bacterium]|jgi:hypothetical protein